MILEIKNDCMTAEISTFGAELQSVKNTDGTEFMWSGDADVWSGRAPVLFPICGALKDGKYKYKDKEYFLEKHGFARNSEFKCVKSDDSYAEFMLCDSEKLKEKYPFDFKFSIIYELNGNTLDVTYKVKNTGGDTMYFSLGAHEAYSCPEGIDNYRVIFENDDELTLFRAVEGGLVTDNGTPFPLEEKSFILSKDMFVDDALIFLEHKSRKVYLENIKTNKKITVDFNGFNYLLLWTKPGGNYICIEPWTGIPDRTDCSGILSEKEGITALDKSCDYILKHSIKFEK